MSNRDSLRAFYVDDVPGEPSRFHVWERGEAVGDSVTPATYSPAYREWITDLLRDLLDEDAGLLSAGCGNATVEARLHREGYRVLAVDLLPEAVRLARAKGVDAVVGDLRTWTPPAGPWRVVYADGVLGHLYEAGALPVLSRLRDWLAADGWIVVSVDGPRAAATTERHPGAPGFRWLSAEFLSAQLRGHGFDDVSSTVFTYRRPCSGARDRVVVTARKGGL